MLTKLLKAGFITAVVAAPLLAAGCNSATTQPSAVTGQVTDEQRQASKAAWQYYNEDPKHRVAPNY